MMNLQERCLCGGICRWSTLYQVYVCETCEKTRGSAEMKIVKDYLYEQNKN